MPTHKMSAIFGGHGYGKNSMLEVGQVREVVTSYIKANDLVAKDNPRFESSSRFGIDTVESAPLIIIILNFASLSTYMYMYSVYQLCTCIHSTVCMCMHICMFSTI